MQPAHLLAGGDVHHPGRAGVAVIAAVVVVDRQQDPGAVSADVDPGDQLFLDRDGAARGAAGGIEDPDGGLGRRQHQLAVRAEGDRANGLTDQHGRGPHRAAVTCMVHGDLLTIGDADGLAVRAERDAVGPADREPGQRIAPADGPDVDRRTLAAGHDAAAVRTPGQCVDHVAHVQGAEQRARRLIHGRSPLEARTAWPLTDKRQLPMCRYLAGTPSGPAERSPGA